MNDLQKEHPQSLPGLTELVQYCDHRLEAATIPDFSGAVNGLQVDHQGAVHKIGAAVDAGIATFQQAATAGVDFLVVHHGLFWSPMQPICGKHYSKLKLLFDHNIALYSSHLPLDRHPELGNNSILAGELGLEPVTNFCPYQGCNIGLITQGLESRKALRTAQRPATSGLPVARSGQLSYTRD